MFFEVTLPDGSKITVSPQELACAEIWGTLNLELSKLVSMLKSLVINDSLEYGNRTWKRLR